MTESKAANQDPHRPEGDTGYQEEESHSHDADEPDTYPVAPYASAALAVSRTNVPKVLGSVVVYGNPAEPDSKPNDDSDLLPKGESGAQAGNGAAMPAEQEAGSSNHTQTKEDLIAELQEKQLLIDDLKDELDKITQLKREADQALEEAERRHEGAITTKDDEIDGLKEKVEHYRLKLSKFEKKNGKRKEEEEPVQDQEQVSKEDYSAELEKKDQEIQALRAIINGRERDAKQALQEAVQRLERAEEVRRAADETLKQKQRKEQEEAEKLRAKEDEKTQKIERFISVASSISSISTESDTQGCTNLDSQASCDAST